MFFSFKLYKLAGRGFVIVVEKHKLSIPSIFAKSKLVNFLFQKVQIAG